MPTRTRNIVALAAVVILTILSVPLRSQITAQAGITEAEVKAGYLINFGRFVEWPVTAFRDRSSPVVIGVVGNSPVEAALNSIAGVSTIAGRPVHVRGGQDLSAIGPAHILFFPASEKKRTTQMIESLKGSPVLIVGEIPEFAKHGGMVNFYLEDGRIRFEMNPEAAQRAGVQIKAHVLSLARIVRDTK